MTDIEAQARSVFLAALERPAEEWPAFLDEACGGNAALRARVETADVPVLDLEGTEWARCPSTDPARAGLTPGHLAYVIYTSGSTGRPKGVAVPHRGVVNLLSLLVEE